MQQRNLNTKAFSSIEYVALTGFILAALFVFQHYIVRGLGGRVKSTGDTFGQMRQYDPRPYGVHGEGGGTLECVYLGDPDGPGRIVAGWREGSCVDHCTTDACRYACPIPVDCN
jgi:hypothetical protein